MSASAPIALEPDPRCVTSRARILAYLREQGIATAPDTARALGIDPATVATVYREAAIAGAIRSVGTPGLYCMPALGRELDADIRAYRERYKADAAAREAML